jgi:uncharacterized protein YbjT (DUF2867 family)
MTTGMTNQLITVFGGSGFLGRYVVQGLLKAGARVRIAARDPRGALFLKTQGGLGQTQFIAADITKPDSVARALSGSDAVVNLVGSFANMDAIQHIGASNVAEAAAAAGVKALVHVSAIGADPESAAVYGRSKGDGETAVRVAFPSATILRPSIVFGREDQFVNRFANLIRMMPVVPIIKGDAKFQPVYVGDVSKAVVAALADPGAHGGKTYELGGPEVISMGGLNRWIAKATGRKRAFIDLPDFVAGTMASATGWLPGAPMTKDQWLMLQSDNIVAADAKGLSAFGIVATPLESVADGWLVQYRRHGRFAQPKA